MRKIALSIVFSGLSTLSFAQFSITTTGLTFSGNALPGTGTNGQFYQNQPNNGGGTLYTDVNCNNTITQGPGASEVGGFDSKIFDAEDGGNSNGVTFFGGKLRTVYYGAPCVPNIPSFGFHTGTSTGIASGTNVDLSLAANQKIRFSYRSDVAISLQLQLFDAAYNTKLTTVPVSLAITGTTTQTITVDFSSNIAEGAVMTDVRQVAFLYNAVTLSPSFGISISDIQLGSSVTTGNAMQAYVLKETVVYPNPTADFANLEIHTLPGAQLNVSLRDAYGQEVSVLYSGASGDLLLESSIPGIANGIYTVVMEINQEIVDVQKLVVY
jgi:hypothetical protein